MQHRYAGDVGDFIKYALLHSLTGAPGNAPLRVGVNWYLVADESHSEDAKFTGYLEQSAALGAIDSLLFGQLQRAMTQVSSGRGLHLLRAEGVFGDWVEYEQLIPQPATRAPSAVERDRRTLARHQWAQGALHALVGADMVFVDPDNGLTDRHRCPPSRAHSVKHAYFDEVGPYLDRGQSLVAYHHADRSADVVTQAQRLLNRLGEFGEPLGAVRSRLGTTRLFLIVPAQDHRVDIAQRVEHFVSLAPAGTVSWVPAP